MTSRTNITEALRRLHDAYYAIPAGEPTTEQVMQCLPELYAAVDAVLSDGGRISGLLATAAAAQKQNTTIHVATEATCKEHLSNLNGYRTTIASEPHSDAVTAPDEPSTEAGRTLLDVLHAVRVSGMSIRQCIVAIEREARAASSSVERDPINGQPPKFPPASASVPPLHTDDAGSPLGSTTEGTSFGPKPAGDVSGELGLRDASLASAIVTESVTSAVPSLDPCTPANCWRQRRLAYAAEAPEQGRGDE